MTTTLTTPDVDIEELLDQQIPCQGFKNCPNEVTWLFQHRCCGVHWLACQGCHDFILNSQPDFFECKFCGTSTCGEVFFSRIVRL